MELERRINVTTRGIDMASDEPRVTRGTESELIRHRTTIHALLAHLAQRDAELKDLRGVSEWCVGSTLSSLN